VELNIIIYMDDFIVLKMGYYVGRDIPRNRRE
jgi:hypothetical protein